MSVEVTVKFFIFRGVARRLMRVRVKVTTTSFMFWGVARALMTVSCVTQPIQESMQVEDLRWRRLQFLRPGLALAVEPEDMQAVVPGRLDIVDGMITDMQGLVGRQSGPGQSRLKEGGIGPGSADTGCGQRPMKEATQGRALWIGVAIGHRNQPVVRCQDTQHRNDIRIGLDLIAVCEKQGHTLRRQGGIMTEFVQK